MEIEAKHLITKQTENESQHGKKSKNRVSYFRQRKPSWIYRISEAINNIEEFAHFNDNFIWKSLQSMETKEWEESREPFIFLLNK